MKTKTIIHCFGLFLLLLYVSIKSNAQYPYIHNFNSENTKEVFGEKGLYHIGLDADSCIIISTTNGIIRYNGASFIEYVQKNKTNRYLPVVDAYGGYSALNYDWIISPLKNNNIIYLLDKNHQLDSIKIKNLDVYSSRFKDGQILSIKSLSAGLACAYLPDSKDLIAFFRLNQQNKIEQIAAPKGFYKGVQNITFNNGNMIADTTNKIICFYENNQWHSIDFKHEKFVIADVLKIGNYLFCTLVESPTKKYIISYDLISKKELGRKSVLNVGGIEIQQLDDKHFLYISRGGSKSVVVDKYLEPASLGWLSPQLLQNIKDFCFDSNKNLWFSLQDKTLVAIARNSIASESKFWHSKGTRRIATDKYGNIWVGQETGDLLCYHDNRLDTVRLNKPFLTFIRGIVAIDDQLWVVNDSQLLRLQIPLISFKNRNKVIDTEYIGGGKKIEFYNLPKGISPKSHLYFSVSAKQIIKNIDGKNIILCNRYMSLQQKNNKYQYEFKHLLEKDQIRNYSAQVDAKNRLWLGRETGFYLQESLIKEIPKVAINDIEIDKNGNIWVATDGEGLWIYDPQHKKSRQLKYTQKARVMDICFDINGAWIAGDNGLTFLNRQEKIYSYGFASGLPATFIYAILSSDSMLYIGTSNGFMAVNKQKFKESYLRPSVLRFEEASISGKNLLKANNSFAYDENYLTIQLKDLSFDLKHKDFQYEYHLINDEVDLLKQEAQTTDLNRTFPSLAAGDYQFYVIRKGLDGQSYGQTPVLRFTISPPFWKSWWFISLIAIISSLSVYFYLRKQRAIEIQINELELDSLSAQMNPHFIGNGLNAVADIILNENDKFKAYNFIAIFSGMVRQFMENTRKRVITIENEKQFLENYIEIEKQRFFEIGFEHQIQIDAPLSTEIPAGMMQPLVENAIKHGILSRKEGGILKISFAKHEKKIECIIEDNGKGFQNKNNTQSSTHQSASLQNIERRITLMKNSKFYKSATMKIINKSVSGQQGTQIILTFIEK